MPRSTKEEALETRTRILDAAENVFHARGVSHTSLADVAQAAGVTRGAIYWHFKNKDDLFDAMCRRVQLPMEAMMEATADERTNDPLGELRRTGIYVLHQAAKNPHSRKVFDILFHRCEFVDGDPISIRQQTCFLQGMTNIERILSNAIAKEQLPQDLDTHLASISFQAALVGLLNNWLFAPASFDLATDAAKLIDASLNTLRTASSLRQSAVKPQISQP
jgi:TetR/AcrR family acrAB operon transcriptional repressor